MKHKTHNIVITGGAGFIGSNLCDRLVQKGHRIICVDNLLSSDVANIRPLLNHPNFQFIEHDISVPFTIPGPVDRIYNLACPASPAHYQRDPLSTMKTCVLGAFHVLEIARQKNARILQASTSEVYGDPEVHPQSETYVGHVNPIGPRACYDEGKRAAETVLFDYHRVHGVSIKAARIFNTYGPRMMENDGRVVSNFVVQALRNEAITLYGDGRQTRSFCYVDDLLEGLELLMESPPEVTGPINLGNPHEVSVKHIAETVLKLTNSRSPIVRRPLPQDDPKRRRPVVERAREMIGWRPRTALDLGLRRTVDYFALKIFTPSGKVRSVETASVRGQRRLWDRRSAPVYPGPTDLAASKGGPVSETA